MMHIYAWVKQYFSPQYAAYCAQVCLEAPEDACCLENKPWRITACCMVWQMACQATTWRLH